MDELSNLEKRVLRGVGKVAAAGGGHGVASATPDQVLAAEGLEQLVQVMNAASWLQSKGLVNLHDTVEETVLLTEQGRKALASGLPERRLADAVRAVAEGGVADMDAVKSSMDAKEFGIGFGVLKTVGWLRMDG